MSLAPQLLPVEQWRITRRQERAMNALCEAGSIKAAADQIGVTFNSLDELLRRLRYRVTVQGQCSTTMIALAWDRSRREVSHV